MALGDSYMSLAEAEGRMNLDAASVGAQPTVDTDLQSTLDSATSEINEACHRQFNRVEVASPRLFAPLDWETCYVDDFWTDQDLLVEVDAAGTGDFTALSASDYELNPLNGVMNGEPWPYTRILAKGGKRFRHYANFPTLRPRMRVTAKWGWVAVPKPIKEACFILATDTYGLKNSPYGVVGLNEFGIVKVRNNPMAQKKYERYIRQPVLI